MLRQLRSQRTMKTTMWVVAAAFAVGFLFLGQGLNVGSGPGVQTNLAGVVNGVKIQYEAYNNRVTQLSEQERAQSGRDDLTSTDYERLEAQAWDAIVTEVLVNQEANRLGLRAADDEVVSFLESNPPGFVRQEFLDEQGNFDVAAFQAALADPRTDWRQAEAYVRGILPSLKLQQMVAARATVSELEVRQEFARRTLKHTVRFVGQRWSDIPVPSAAPSDDELQRTYQDHASLFARGEQVVVEAIRIDKRPSAEDEEELRAESLGILRELTTGATASFAALAEIYSDDPSASQGGAVGWVRRGFLPAVVDEAVWSLQPGMRTAPITAERGVYVVQVDSARTTADGERELSLRQLFLALQPSGTTLDSLRTLAYTVADAAKHDFAAAAAQHGFTVEKLEPLQGPFIPGFGFSQRLHDWAFAAAPGSVGGPFGNDGTILVLRVVEHQAAGQEPFESVRERVLAAFQEQRRKDAARTKLEAVAQALRAGASLDAAAAAQGLEVRAPEPFTFYDNVPEVGGAGEFAAAASALEPGQTSAVVESLQGAYVLHLVAREALDEARYAESRAEHYRSLRDRRIQTLFEAWLEDLRAAAKIDDRRLPRV